MLFMVIERFKLGNAQAVGDRFKSLGRMLPEGVQYHASWVASSGLTCFQLMETANPEMLVAWTNAWQDLIEFEIIPVKTSGDFWSGYAS